MSSDCHGDLRKVGSITAITCRLGHHLLAAREALDLSWMLLGTPIRLMEQSTYVGSL